MNLWAQMLQDLPALAQRQIARAQRISLPRGCGSDTRLARLRQSLCRQTTVRAIYLGLDEATQTAIQDLRARRGGIAPDELTRRYGALRAWRQLAADPRPHTISERLLLLGWLLPRPATPRHPMRYLVPPELRRCLPRPLTLELCGTAPAPELSLGLRAAATILLGCAERPLPMRSDGTPRRAALRLLARKLGPVGADAAAAVIQFVLPLLGDLGLVSTYGGTCRMAPAGQRFLALPPAVRLRELRRAWLAAPRSDAWLMPLLNDDIGIDWPLLRRRLCDWVGALPEGRLVVSDTLYNALAASFGPLADAHTHGFRHVDRAPWQPRRARAIFDAALRGPLRWLGLVGWQGAHEVFRTPEQASMPQDLSSARWVYGAPGEIRVVHEQVDARLLRLLPYADRQIADDWELAIILTPRSIARAASKGWDETSLWALLERQAGAYPATWRAHLDAPRATVELAIGGAVLTAPPGVLERASRSRSVRRCLDGRLAPGIALVRPEHVAPLGRALAQQDIACVETLALPNPSMPDGATAGTAAIGRRHRRALPVQHPGECAALLVACAFYREHAPAEAPLLPDHDLERRLYQALSPPLRAATDAALADLRPRTAPQLVIAPDPQQTSSVAAAVAQLRAAQDRQQAVTIIYNTAEEGSWTRRVVRPIALEQRGETWYLRAYCTARGAERTFRVDRIGSIASGAPG